MAVMKYNDMVIYFFPTEYIRRRVGDTTSFWKRKEKKTPAVRPLRLIVSLKQVG